MVDTLTLDKLQPFDIDPELRSYFLELERLLKEIGDTVSPGGGSVSGDLLLSASGAIGAIRSKLDNLEGRLSNDIPSINHLLRSVASQSFSDVETAQDYTANNWEDIEASLRIVIKLPLMPSVNSEVIVGNSDGRVKTISGNGKKIKRISLTDCLKTERKGTRLHFRYKIDRDYWVLV